jgi:hypothetical protein
MYQPIVVARAGTDAQVRSERVEALAEAEKSRFCQRAVARQIEAATLLVACVYLPIQKITSASSPSRGRIEAARAKSAAEIRSTFLRRWQKPEPPIEIIVGVPACG